MEAHGGYSFCGIAALTLLNKTKLCDLDALLVGYYYLNIVDTSLACYRLKNNKGEIVY